MTRAPSGGASPAPADAWRALDYAGQVTVQLADALEDLGFDCAVYDERDLPTARDLGSLVQASVTTAPSSAARLVHVLSHGHDGKSGVYVVGADGRWEESTKVSSWIASIEDSPNAMVCRIPCL